MLLDYLLLDFLQDQLAFRQSEAESFYGHTVPLELAYVLRALLTGVAHRVELEAELLRYLPYARSADKSLLVGWIEVVSYPPAYEILFPPRAAAPVFSGPLHFCG